MDYIILAQIDLAQIDQLRLSRRRLGNNVLVRCTRLFHGDTSDASGSAGSDFSATLRVISRGSSIIGLPFSECRRACGGTQADGVAKCEYEVALAHL